MKRNNGSIVSITVNNNSDAETTRTLYFLKACTIQAIWLVESAPISLHAPDTWERRKTRCTKHLLKGALVERPGNSKFKISSDNFYNTPQKKSFGKQRILEI